MGRRTSPFDIRDLNPDWWFDINRTDLLTLFPAPPIVQRVKSIVEPHAMDQAVEARRAVLFTAPFAANQVLSFDGVDDRYNTSIIDNLSGGFEITAVATTPTGAGGNKNIFAQNDGTGTGRAIIFVRGSGLAASFFGNVRLESTTVVDDGEFHVISIRYNEATTTLRIYIDGLLENTGSRNNELATGLWVVGTNKAETGDFLNGLFGEGFKITGETSDQVFNAYQRFLCQEWGVEYKGPDL